MKSTCMRLETAMTYMTRVFPTWSIYIHWLRKIIKTKQCKSAAKLPRHHNIKVSFRVLSFCINSFFLSFMFSTFFLLSFYINSFFLSFMFSPFFLLSFCRFYFGIGITRIKSLKGLKSQESLFMSKVTQSASVVLNFQGS